MGNYNSNSWSTTDAVHRLDPVVSPEINPLSASDDHNPDAPDNLPTEKRKNEDESKRKTEELNTTAYEYKPNSSAFNMSQSENMKNEYSRQSEGSGQVSTSIVFYGCSVIPSVLKLKELTRHTGCSN